MKKRFQVTLLVLLLGVGGALLFERQAALDWLHLRGYTPPVPVAQLAADDTMTPKAQHLFYVNHPAITTGRAFTDNCPAGSEKTVVLGCYVGNDAGIFVYAVADTRLDGVEQVTAAHEMLHAAYRRLPGSERARVNAMLLDYYQHGLTDQRIKAALAAYKVSEPHDVVNEMHSIFGTEVADLPPALEQYYRQYFTNRQKIAAYTANYQAEFTNRQDEVTAYDTQLKALKQRIDANQAGLAQQQSALTAERPQLQENPDSSRIADYNRQVTSYNSLLADTKNLINQYNTIVDKRNAVVLEEQQLQQELSAKSLPAR